MQSSRWKFFTWAFNFSAFDQTNFLVCKLTFYSSFPCYDFVPLRERDLRSHPLFVVIWCGNIQNHDNISIIRIIWAQDVSSLCIQQVWFTVWTLVLIIQPHIYLVSVSVRIRDIYTCIIKTSVLQLFLYASIIGTRNHQ